MSDEKKAEAEETNKPSSPLTEVLSEETINEKSEEVIEETAKAASKDSAPESDLSEEKVEEKKPKAKAKKKAEEETDDHDEVASSDEVVDHENEKEEKAQIDYHSLSENELITELKSLIKKRPVNEIKHEVEEIKTEFYAKFQDELEHQKEEFLAGGGNIIDFHYTTPIQKEFSSVLFDYREKRNNHYKNLKKDLQANLQRRNELIEELKGLLNAEENINTTYKHYKEIQERWHVAGPIPRDKYNMVWNTYHHHVENFYDFLHLNREFRDMDFKHNLESKLKLIGRAEELGQEEDVGKAFRELQMLHKMWKEEIGPVAKEFRDEVWDKFSAATKVIHDKRHEYQKGQEKEFEQNFENKKLLISQIGQVTESTKQSHQAWQNSIKKVQELRDAYFDMGKVPRSKNKEIWASFKEVTRNFNKNKNAFYKNQKKAQYTNLEKKKELIEIAEANKESEDFEVVTPLMKKIQKDWRDVGHVPRKDSDKVWKQFKAACNHYFDRLHAQKNEANKEQLEHFVAKEAMLKELSQFEPTGDAKADIEGVKAKITDWKNIGRVPYNKKDIEQKFNKTLDGLFGKLNVDKKEVELIKFENKLNTMVSREDERKLQNEQFFISKKIDESKNEIIQLENNLGFFQHVPDDNPVVKEVHQNIARHKEQLEVWKEKLKKIKSMRNA